MSGGKVAIVTGAAQGFGAEISKLLLKEGYSVCLSDLQSEAGEKLRQEYAEMFGSGRVAFVKCDVTKAEEYHELLINAKKKLGEVKLLVNNAGIMDELKPEKTITVNLIGALNACLAGLEHMGTSNGGTGGTIINIASIAGFVYHHSCPAYAASKHGVVGLTRSYGTSYHYERNHVLFHALCPTLISTPLLGMFVTNSLVPGMDVRPGGLMSPEYAASGILKLLEDKINGSTLVIDSADRLGPIYVGVQNEVQRLVRA